MAQFDIYTHQGAGIEYLLDLQDDLLEHLSTRVVAPLALPETVGAPMKIVNPRISVGGVQYLLLTHLLAAIPAASLGQQVGSAKAQRDEIVGAIDFLFTGI
ncbi:CcdB family protein [Desulfuromonas thiophila]|jgi:toxin CcdB|uniref:CcdB family protein n=1 Tax=Desulfuromonas thiophila TaxID=57664 RepID=UPI0024A92A43|nr:CcdB family protein [Desulfuromonas thiophila]